MILRIISTGVPVSKQNPMARSSRTNDIKVVMSFMKNMFNAFCGNN